MSPSLADRVDSLLPQTQCTKCGFPSCRAYAEALATGDAGINQCPPGGDAGIRQLASLLSRAYQPLHPGHGVERPRQVARIDEQRCIGCTLCIQACPVDAIAGGPKLMHTVLTHLCSGCDLCVAPCPVDCIEMIPAAGEEQIWDEPRAAAARQRFEHRGARLAREREQRALGPAQRAPAARPTAGEQDKKRAAVEAAVARAREKKAAAQRTPR